MSDINLQDNSYQTKLFRGSSPQEEIRQGFIDWVRGLRSIGEVPEDFMTTPLVEPRANPRMESGTPAPFPQQESDDEGRWQDDGGESS